MEKNKLEFLIKTKVNAFEVIFLIFLTLKLTNNIESWLIVGISFVVSWIFNIIVNPSIKRS